MRTAVGVICHRTRVAHVANAIVVYIGLIGVDVQRAIIVAFADAVAVGIVFRIEGADIDIAHAVAVGIRLIRIGRVRTIILVIHSPIAIAVGTACDNERKHCVRGTAVRNAAVNDPLYGVRLGGQSIGEGS